MALLPDREIATVRAWLSAHLEIRVVSRDRGGGYGEAVAKALPDALQVADRWHLVENASAAFQQIQKVPSARTIARLMTMARDHLSKADTVTVAVIEARVPMLVGARYLIERFQAMVRQKAVAELEPWIAAAGAGLMESFASGILKDKAAVCAAITEP